MRRCHVSTSGRMELIENIGYVIQSIEGSDGELRARDEGVSLCVPVQSTSGTNVIALEDRLQRALVMFRIFVRVLIL
jgi:hypothetical protein